MIKDVIQVQTCPNYVPLLRRQLFHVFNIDAFILL